MEDKNKAVPLDDMPSNLSGQVVDESDLPNSISSPKSTAPSMQGGESGAQIPPTTSTSVSETSSLGSWTTEANPLKPKVPTQVPLAKGQRMPIQEVQKDVKLFNEGKTIRQEPKKTKLGTVAFDLNEVKRNVAENPIKEVPLTQAQAFKEVVFLEKRAAAVDSLSKGQAKIFEANKAALDSLGAEIQTAEEEIKKLAESGNQQEAEALYEKTKPLLDKYNTQLRDVKKQILKLEYLDNRKKTIDSDMANISEGQQYTTNQWSALNAGLSSLTANILRAPSFVYNSMIALQNKIAKETGIPIAANPQTDGYLQQAAQYFQDNADAYNKVIEKKKAQTDYNIQNLLERGETLKAFNLLSESVMESAPTTAAIALSGMAGVGAFGTTMGGAAVFGNQTFEENKKNGIDDNTNYLNSWVNGTLEGIFEATGTLQIVKHGADLFKKEGKKAVEETAKTLWEKVYGKVAKKMFPATSAVLEGVSEAETAFTQNYVNMISGVDAEYKKDYNNIVNSDMSDLDKEDALSELSKQHLFQGVPDAFYVGAAMGGGMGLMQAKSGYTAVDNKKKEEIKKSQETLENLNKTLTNPLVSPEAKEIIQAKADAEAEKIALLAEEDDRKLRENLTKDEYDAVTDIQSKIETLEKSLDTIEDKESKSLIEQQIKELESKKEGILISAYDNLATRIQEKRKELGVEFDPLEGLSETVANTFSRIEDNLPTDINAVQEASDFLYRKYKELQAMKSSTTRPLTIAQINDFMGQMEKDITMLETYKDEQRKSVEETLKKNTSPTNEKYGTVNRNDGKGVVDLTKEEYLREEGKGKTTAAIETNTKVVGDKIVELQATPEAEAGTTTKTETDGKETKGNEEAQVNVLNPETEQGVEKSAPIVIKPELPTIDLKQENPFNKELVKLGYEQSDIDKMTMEQKQEIAINKTQAPIVESSAKVDSVKENAKQEKIAAAQAKLDEELKAEEDVNIQQQVDKGKDNVGAVGDVAKEGEGVKEPTQEQETTEQGNKKEVANEALKDVEATAKALEGVELKPNEVSQFNDDWVSKRIFKEDSFFGSKAKINVLRATRDDIISSLSPKQQTEIVEIYEAEMKRLQGNPYAKDAAIERVFDKLKEYAPSLKKRFEKQTKGAEPFKEYLNDAIIKIKELRERSEAYHKAKTDGSNPELVKAVEELLGKKPTTQQSEEEKIEATAKALEVVQRENVDKFVNDFANIDIPFRQENIQAEMDSAVKKQLFPNEKTRRKYAETIYSAVVRSSNFPKILSEAYHKAKADGSNPELVKAVEELLTPKANEKSNPKSAAVNKQVNPPSEVKGEVEQVDNKGEVGGKITELNNQINELKASNPTEFKKDGGIKAKSKLASTYKSLLDKRNSLIDNYEKTYEEEFTQLAKEEKEKSKAETEQINKEFEERKSKLDKNLTDEEKIEIRVDDLIEKSTFEPLTKEEVDFINENAFLPSGFKYGENGLEKIKSKSTPKSPKTEGEKTAKQNPINEPKNAVGVARIFRKLFNFTPQESILAARLFDAKATFMAKVKGISKEDYYKEYWFGNDVNGGLDQFRKGSWTKEAAKAKRLISMYQKANSSTAVHEILGHDFLDRIIEASATNKEFEEDLNTIVDEYIKATGSKAKKSVLLNDLKNFDVENNQNANGKAIHEWFAKSAESYMKNEKGAKAGTKLAQVFEKFRKYLSEIYNQMTGDLIPPSKPMVEIFRKAFGTENFDIINEYANEQINETQKDLINNKESKIKLTDEDINEFERLRNEQGLAQDENVVTYEKLFKAALYYKQKGYANVHSIGDELKLLFPSAAKEIDYYLEDFRDIFVPRGERISQTGESAYNSELVDEEVKKELGKRGAYTYKPQSLKVAVNKVKALIDEMGLEQAIEAWKNGDVENNMPESSQPVFAAIVAQRTNALIKQLKKGTRADKEEAKRLSELQSDIIEKHIQKGEEAGRTLNAYKVMAMMSADGIMRFWKKKFNNLNKETKFKLKQQIDELMPKLEKAYKDAEYLFFESASNEELAGRYKEELEQKDKEIAELTKRKANYKPKETVRGGKRNDAKAPKISDAELKERLSRLKKSQGLGQDIESLSDRNAVGYYIIQNKPTGLVKFVKEWNKLTGEKQDVNSLRDLYEEVRDFSVKENYYDSDWFDSDADIDEAVNEYLENKVKVEEQLAKKELEKEILKARNEAFKKQMSDKDKEVKAKDALKKREKEIVGDFLDSLSQEGLWQKYVSANAGKIIGNLSSKIGGKPSEKALLDKFIQLATNEINNAINELTPNQKAAKTTPNYAQQLGDLMANQDKVAEVFDKAISDFAEQHQNDVNAQALLSKLNGLKNPFSEGLLGKALEAQAEKIDRSIKDYAFQFKGIRSIAKRQFVGEILKESELQGAEFDQLKQSLYDKFNQVIEQAEQDTAGQLASAVISDAKKQALNKVGKKDYLTELLGYLKNKAKDTYEKGTTKKLTDPFEQMKYAMEMLNDSNGRKIWEDSQKEIAARIDNDNSLSQTEKDSLKNFLQDYETTLFDQLLSENKLLKNIQKVLIEDGNFVKGNSVDWKGIIVDAKGKPEAVKEIIKGILGDKLTNLGYSQPQIDNMLDAISRKYDNVIKEKKVEIADAQFNKIANPPQRKKKTIAKGKIQNLIEMENSGLLSRSQVEDEIGKWLGVKEMTNQKWAKLRELAEKVEESPEGNERDLAIDEMAAFIRLNSIGRYAEIYAALTYTGMLGRPITTLKNATGIIEPLLTMFYKAFYDPNYAKAMLSYSTRRDFTDVMKGGQVQGSRLDVQVGKDGLPYTNVLKGLSREQGGFFKKLASKAELLTRPLGAFDALSQAMVTGGEDYRQLVEQKIEQGKTLREARKEALEEMTNQTTYASSLAEAEKEFATRGIVPTQARLERRAFEIMRNTYVTDMMKEISTLASLEQAYKSKIDLNASREETNRGIFTLAGGIAQKMVRGFGEGAGYLASGAAKGLGASEATVKSVDEQASKIAQMKLMPFIRGISNVMQSGMDKVAGVATGSIGLWYENKRIVPKTPEEAAIQKYMIERHKTQIGKSVATMLIGGAFYAMLLDEDDEEKEKKLEQGIIPNGIYPAGEVKWGSGNKIKRFQIPQASMVINGHVTPLSYMGTLGIGSLMVANGIAAYQKSNEKEKPKDPDALIDAPITKQILSSTGSTILNMSTFQGTSEIMATLDPTSTKTSSDYVQREAVKSIALAIPFVGTAQQVTNLSKVAAGKNKAQTAIGFKEKAYKELGLDGLMYDRPVVDYRGREIPMAKYNVEGSGGLDAITSKWELDPLDKYLIDIKYNPKLDKRTDIVDADNNAMSKEDYYDYSVAVGKQFGQFLKDNEFVIINKEFTPTKSGTTSNEQKRKKIADYQQAVEKINQAEYKYKNGKIDLIPYQSQIREAQETMKRVAHEFHKTPSLP